MNPLTSGVIDRIRHLRSKVPNPRRSPRPEGRSPYTAWHGPISGSSPTLRVQQVADLTLIQGTAAHDVPLRLEIEGDPTLIDLTHRFPHLNNPNGPTVCFESTIDSLTSATAKRVRLVVDGTAQDWVDLPDPTTLGAMTGVDTLASCPACGSGRLSPVGRRQQLTMASCHACGLVMTNPRPPEDHTLVRYNEQYFDDEYLPSQELTPTLLHHIDSILDRAEPAKAASDRLFEVGVGGGNLANRAAARGWTVSGTDVNPASVKHVGQGALNVWLENSDHAESLGGTYGAIISEMSLEHVRHPERLCALAAEALAPGGRLVIYTVSAEGASFEHAGMASPLVGPAEHLFLFSAGSLVALCQGAGLRVDELWRNSTGDEIGIVAIKRRDVGNPAIS